MARESSLWNWLKKARSELGDRLHMERVENIVAAGTPDVEGFLENGAENTGQFWLELKSALRPMRPTTPVRLALQNREAQIEWLRKRWEVGGNAFFLVQVGEHSDRTLFLLPGTCGAALRDGMTESAMLVAACNTGVFFKKSLHHVDILTRAVTCRQNFPCFPK